MDGQILLGRELTVVFAEENRKKPSEMRARERVRWGFFTLELIELSTFYAEIPTMVLQKRTCLFIFLLPSPCILNLFFIYDWYYFQGAALMTVGRPILVVQITTPLPLDEGETITPHPLDEGVTRGMWLSWIFVFQFLKIDIRLILTEISRRVRWLQRKCTNRSISPRGRRFRDRSYSRSPYRSRSRSRSFSRSRSRSQDY